MQKKAHGNFPGTGVREGMVGLAYERGGDGLRLS